MWIIRLLTAALAVLGIVQAVYAAYPEKPVRIVVGFAAGGPTDVVARLIAERLSQLNGQAFIVSLALSRNRGCARARGWVHAAGDCDQPCHQSGDPDENSLRHGARLRGDHAGRGRAARAGGERTDAVQLRRGGGYVREGASERTHLFVVRAWRHGPLRRRDVRGSNRRLTHARALQRCRTFRAGPGRRPGADVVRVTGFGRPAREIGTAKAAGCRRSEATR